MPVDEHGWVPLQRQAGEEPEADEAAALQLLKRELGAQDSLDEAARFMEWNARIYEKAADRRAQTGALREADPTAEYGEDAAGQVWSQERFEV
jgi:hypothetical protein